MADTSGCCGGPRGKHLDGCIGGTGYEARRRGKQARQRHEQRERVKKSVKNEADGFVKKWKNTKFTTYTTGPSRLKPGTKMVRDGDYYRIVIDNQFFRDND